MAFPTSYGVVQGRKVQIVKEVTKGTRVAIATALLRGPQEGLVSVQPPVFVPENIGYAAQLDNAYVPYKYGTLKMPARVLTFEQIYEFAAGIKALTSGVQDGSGSGYAYAYPLSTTLPANDITTYSIQAGDDQRAMFAAYGFVEQIVLTGVAKQAWTIESNWITRPAAPLVYTASTIAFTNSTSITDSASLFVTKGFAIGDKIVVTGTVSNNGTYTITNVAAGTLTVTETTATEAAGTPFTLTGTYSSVSPASCDVCNFSQTRFFVDAVSGTLGGTAIQGVLQQAKVTINTGFVGLAASDGDGATTPVPTFSLVRLDPSKMSMQIDATFYSNSNSLAEQLNYLNNTSRQMRLRCVGPTLATAGDNYTNKLMMIDAAGKFTAWPAFTEVDGNNVWNVSFVAKDNLTASLYGRVTVVNELANLV